MTPRIAAHDRTEIWVPETVPAILARAVRDRPEQLALVAGDCSLTYAQYGEAVECLARRMAATCDAGDVVVIVLPNMAATAIAIFAVQSAGCVAATLNPDYTACELAPMIEDAAPSAAILSTEAAARIGPMLRAGIDVLLVDSDAGLIEKLKARRGDPEPCPRRAPLPDDLAVLQFTGGSTGRPKGVELTHRAVATNVAQREAVLPTEYGDERILCFMPMFHSFAAAMCVNLAAYCAGALFILPKYRPDLVLDAIGREAITRLPAGPTVFNSLVQHEELSRDGTASLRCAYSGSAPLGLDTLEKWEALTNVPIYEGYGQSEAGPILTYFGPGHHIKPGSVGPPLPLTELRIADPEDHARDMPSGEAGEIVARGPQIMSGYRGLPKETRDALKDGWLHTGDIGVLDGDGNLTIADRKKDMVLISGYNVFPREVDEALGAHRDIVQAACVGVPDDYRGERLIAFVVARNGSALESAQLEEWLAEKLVRYKRPAEYEFVAKLPLTPAGKIDKEALKRRAVAKRADHHVS